MRMRMAQGCLALGLLAGCRSPKPTFDWDVIPEVSVEREVEIALDPRNDRILLASGRHPVEPSLYRGMVMSSLLRKGYRNVSPDQAKLWVSVQALSDGDRSPQMDHAMPDNKGRLSIVVELFEPDKDQPRWRGTVDLPAAREKNSVDTSVQLERLLETIGPAKQG
jgi:hypothetical protein